jgi:hypothetical protein
MHKIVLATAATIMSLFALMIWGHVGMIATNAAVARPSPYAVTSQVFEAVYR